VRKLGDFWPNKLVYLGNSARYDHSCCRCQKETILYHAIEWWHFRWPSVTQPPVSRSPYSSKANILQKCVLRLATWCHAGFSAIAVFFLFSCSMQYTGYFVVQQIASVTYHAHCWLHFSWWVLLVTHSEGVKENTYSPVLNDNLLHHSECVCTMITDSNVSMACVKCVNTLWGWGR